MLYICTLRLHGGNRVTKCSTTYVNHYIINLYNNQRNFKLNICFNYAIEE